MAKKKRGRRGRRGRGRKKKKGKKTTKKKNLTVLGPLSGRVEEERFI